MEAFWASVNEGCGGIGRKHRRRPSIAK